MTSYEEDYAEADKYAGAAGADEDANTDAVDADEDAAGEAAADDGLPTSALAPAPSAAASTARVGERDLRKGSCWTMAGEHGVQMPISSSNFCLSEPSHV